MMARNLSAMAAITGLAAVLGYSAPAEANAILLNLTDAPVQSGTSYDLTFVATSSTTTLFVAGYQPPSHELANDNGVYLNGVITNPNLLGQLWNFTPAALGSFAYQYYDGSSVNGLFFGASVVGDYDVFSQTFNTIAGDSYSYDFLFSEFSPGPSGFEVTTSGSLPGVPEPDTLALFGMALLALGGLGLRRKLI